MKTFKQIKIKVKKVFENGQWVWIIIVGVFVICAIISLSLTLRSNPVMTEEPLKYYGR
jgi:hypothetical protein